MTTTDEEVKKEYHESIINDVYNSMSDSSEEEDGGEEKLDDQITSEAKAKEVEIKRQKDAAKPMSAKIHQSIVEQVNRVHKVVVENANKEAIKGVNDKVKGMFTQAFTKVSIGLLHW